MFKNRKFFTIGYKLATATLLLVAMACLSFREKLAKKQPNIILILSDDQGWGDLSLTGNGNFQTPNIDLIAANGVCFNNFYVSPVCSPTRAELLTGRYHPRTGVHGTSEGSERMNLDETTIADIFKKAGYHTAAFGKWHNGMQYPYHPNGRGFDEFYGFCSGHSGNYFSPLLEHNGQIVKGDGFIIDDLTNKAIDFIDRHRKKPFFVYIPYNTPHSPMQVPDKEWNRFKDKKLTCMGEGRNGKEDPNFTRAALALCENIDENVGRIQKAIERLNLTEDTIIIYLSDNGPNAVRWNNGLKGIKGSTDEGGVKSPMVIQWLGHIPTGAVINERAGAIDLLPTLTDLASININTQKTIDGLSLTPLLLKKLAPWPDRLLFSHWNGRASVRSQRYMLDDHGELYDLLQDPGQTKSISNTHPEQVSWLSDTLKAWKVEVLKGISNDNRPFTVGHPDYKYTQLPARDAQPQGTIRRSSKYPNSSYFTDWSSTDDAIVWDVDILTEGDYHVTMFYSCLPEDMGSVLQLSEGKNKLNFTVGHPTAGVLAKNTILNKRYDRVNRQESYELDFKPLEAGTIHLSKGRSKLKLRALSIPQRTAMEFRLMNLTRR